MVWVWLQAGEYPLTSICSSLALAAVVNDVKCFAFMVDSQLFIRASAKLLILCGLWKPHPSSTPSLLPIRSHGLGQGFPAALLISKLVPHQAPAALLCSLCCLPLRHLAASALVPHCCAC